MQTKTFSLKDETIDIDNGVLRLIEFIKEGDGCMAIIASTDISECNIGSKYYEELYQLPSTLIHKPKTAEELAIQHYKSEYPHLFNGDKPIDCDLIVNTENVFTIKNYNPLTQCELKTAYDKKTSPKHHNRGYKNHRKNNKNRKTHRK